MALTRAAALVAAVRAALAVMPFRSVLRVTDRLAGRRRVPRGTDDERRRMLWATEVAARRLVRSGPCLPQAIVADMLLRRRGFDSHLRIGVARADGGALRAHAWVESGGQVVIGGEESPEDYAAFPDLRPAP